MRAAQALVLGGTAVAIVAIAAFTAPLLTIGPLLDIADAAPIPQTDIVIGDIVFHTADQTHAGILLYSRAKSSTDTLLLDLDAYRNRSADLTPPAVREQLCAVNGTVCDNRSGTEKLLADLDRVYADALEQARMQAEPATTAITRTQNGVLILAAGTLAKPADFAPGIDEVTGHLQQACEANGATAAACAARYHRFRLDLTSNWSLAANLAGAPTNTSVLGPLSWSVVEIGGDAHESTTRIYMPMGALVLVAAVVILLTLSYEYVEFRAGNPFLPLMPLAILVGVAVLIDISRHPTEPRILQRAMRGFGLLVLLYVPLYRLWDASGIQYYSTKVGLVVILAGFVGLLYGVARSADQPLDALVGLLATDGISTTALRATSYALGAMAAVALASLVLSLIGSASARLRGLEVVPNERLDDLVAGRIQLDRSQVDADVELSIWARAWGKIRRASLGYWLLDALWEAPEKYWRDEQIPAWEGYKRAMKRARGEA